LTSCSIAADIAILLSDHPDERGLADLSRRVETDLSFISGLTTRVISDVGSRVRTSGLVLLSRRIDLHMHRYTDEDWTEIRQIGTAITFRFGTRLPLVLHLVKLLDCFIEDTRPWPVIARFLSVYRTCPDFLLVSVGFVTILPSQITILPEFQEEAPTLIRAVLCQPIEVFQCGIVIAARLSEHYGCSRPDDATNHHFDG
jgi:hypothetical protein